MAIAGAVVHSRSSLDPGEVMTFAAHGSAMTVGIAGETAIPIARAIAGGIAIRAAVSRSTSTAAAAIETTATD